ncbi:MAG: enoyl-CoA hydratase/isomerase family protein [Deltaproteobacteria bacterium]|nr:enoyl-CoA hydratase/isomerase family protein [Deltaproteobacteria bacterium]
MALWLNDKQIKNVGIVGSGQIGPDIALYLAQAGVTITVVDVSKEALTKGQSKVKKKVNKLVEKRRLKPEKAEALLGSMTFSSDYQAFAGAQWVIEAATEDLSIKHEIFAQLEAICADDTLLTSNSSHLDPNQLFSALKKPERALVTHFFYPAERNPVVEVVPAEKTDPSLVSGLMTLFELSGKLPVRVAPRYGFAIDPVFEGLCQAAMLAVERGLGTCQQVDAVCQKALGQGVGPFTALNLIGGNPILAIGLPRYHDTIMPWFHSPELLESSLKKAEAWPMAGRGVDVELDSATEERLASWMLGAYFGLAAEVLAAKLINLSDYEDVLGLALDIRPAFSLMNRHGVDASLALVEAFAAENEGFKVSSTLREQAQKKQDWPLQHVQRHDIDGVAVLTIRRFKVLNALNAKVLAELEAHADALANDTSVKGVVLRGFGHRAFVSGADIKELAGLQTPEQAEALARRGQGIVSKFEQLDKKVIAAMNGLAFGGGNELAMACHARLASSGQRVFCGQPEPKLGVIPGYGGTQRLARLVGLKAAWALLRQGNPISSTEALTLGLLHAEVPAHTLLKEAITLAKKATAGEITLKPIPKGPIAVPESLPEVDLGGLSTAIDEILVQATLEGAKTTLEEGLVLEAKAFGRCLEKKDYSIGMKNFLEKGPRSAAEFVNG